MHGIFLDWNLENVSNSFFSRDDIVKCKIYELFTFYLFFWLSGLWTGFPIFFFFLVLLRKEEGTLHVSLEIITSSKVPRRQGSLSFLIFKPISAARKWKMETTVKIQLYTTREMLRALSRWKFAVCNSSLYTLAVEATYIMKIVQLNILYF